MHSNYLQLCVVFSLPKKVKRTGLKSEQVSIKNLEIMEELCIALKQIDPQKMVYNQY